MDVETTEEYWDCECKMPNNYIWPKSIEKCDRCGAKRDEQPDSRVNEVAELLCCPFCGRKPTIEPWHGGAPTKHMVSCSAEFQDQCAVVPATTGENKEEAIKNWNKRI